MADLTQYTLEELNDEREFAYENMRWADVENNNVASMRFADFAARIEAEIERREKL